MSKVVNELEGKEKDISTMSNELQELRELVAINNALQLLAETTLDEKRNLAETLKEKTKQMSIKENDLKDLKEIVAKSLEKIDSIQKESSLAQKELSLVKQGLQQSGENAMIQKSILVDDLEGRKKVLSEKNAEIEELKEKIDIIQEEFSLASEALHHSKDSAEINLNLFKTLKEKKKN